jgi:DNA-binding response OmpR family regulator
MFRSAGRGAPPPLAAGESANMTTPILLLVENESLVREILDTALADAGFEIVVAGSGTQALTDLESDATRFRAVITDIRLGVGQDGWAVGRRARELVPDMPVVYMSGNSSHEWASKGVPNSVMITKPFAPAQLVTAISTLITEAGTHRTG